MYSKFDQEFESFYPRLINRLPATSPARNAAFKDGIKQTFIKSVENKVKIVGALGLPEELRLKLDTTNSKLIEAHPSFKILHKGVSELEEPVVDDKGRTILQMIIENMVTIGKRDQRFSRYVMNKLVTANPNIPWQAHFSALGEVIAQQKKDAFITVNPMDIMFSTEEAGYTSCYRLQGPHGCGNLAYAFDDFTAMTYIKNGDQKIARAFVYFNQKNYKDFIVGKVYGQEPESTAKLISSSILTRLGSPEGTLTYAEELGRDYIKNIASHHNPDHRRYPGFFDKMISARFTTKPSNKYWALNFGNGHCLTCGGTIPTNREQTHCCDTCEARFRPIRCGYCYFTSSDATQFQADIQNTGLRCCKTCFEQRYVKCKTCDAFGNRGYMHNGHCNTCVARLYVNDYKGSRILREEAVKAYDITGREKFCKKLQNGKLPKGLFATTAEAKAAAEAAKAERRALLKDTHDKLGKIQFEFEAEVTGKFKPPANLEAYNTALAELIALD